MYFSSLIYSSLSKKKTFWRSQPHQHCEIQPTLPTNSVTYYPRFIIQPFNHRPLIASLEANRQLRHLGLTNFAPQICPIIVELFHFLPAVLKHILQCCNAHHIMQQEMHPTTLYGDQDRRVHGLRKKKLVPGSRLQ